MGEGAAEILKDPFFAGVDWVRVAGRSVEPPFIPPVTISSNDQDQIPGLCNFDPEYTNITVNPPAKDYLPAAPGDPFDGFYFNHRV